MLGMNLARPSFRFSLRAILLVVAAMACFLGWRLWDFEKATVAAIEKNGGTVYFHYQNPTLAWPPVCRFWLARQDLFLDDVLVDASPRSSPPPPTLSEIVRGEYIANRVAAVNVPLNGMSPHMVARLKSLPNLKNVLVHVEGRVPKDSPDATRIQELREEFPDRLLVTAW